VRLLRLPEEIRNHVGGRALTMGHARALLSLPDGDSQLRVGREIVQKGLSVRDTESLVKRAITPPADKAEAEKDVHTRAAEERLRFALGTRVRIIRKGKSGRIEIDFGDENELHRIYEQLTQKA
jgi:ParB family chromosome partitioning protein